MNLKKKLEKYNSYVDIINKPDFGELNDSVKLSIYKQAMSKADKLINFLSKKCKCGD